MFIPRGKIVHENLATSYVRVDALVVDFCEGGFTGVIEVVLLDADSFVIVNGGDIAAVVEKRETTEPSGNDSFESTTLEQLAERSRLERGRVSIHSYDTATAVAIAGRINAQPLYVGLSNEFTDLEKMVSKLIRERDREWFIETITESGPAALIHIRDGRCRVFYATEASTPDELDGSDSPGLADLLNESNQGGSIFDVYFTPVAEIVQSPLNDSIPSSLPALTPLNALETATNETDIRANPPIEALRLTQEAVSEVEMDPMGDEDDDWGLSPFNLTTAESEREDAQKDRLFAKSAAAGQPVAGSIDAEYLRDEASAAHQSWDIVDADSLELELDHQQVSPSTDAVVMAEIKRLMGEIARTIEEASQSVERPDSFAMHLRAGQLKIADRYPFLDPFAGEIEYLAGEIVFVGRATTDEFIAGLTEALKLAVQGVLGATSYADRFRRYLSEDLRKLLTRSREELESFGLDQVVEEIIEL